jgi:hypothetical protein
LTPVFAIAALARLLPIDERFVPAEGNQSSGRGVRAEFRGAENLLGSQAIG